MADLPPQLGVPFGHAAGEIRKGDKRLGDTTLWECLRDDEILTITVHGSKSLLYVTGLYLGGVTALNTASELGITHVLVRCSIPMCIVSHLLPGPFEPVQSSLLHTCMCG